MASYSNNIIAQAAKVVPDENRFMINRIGGINYSNSILDNTNNESNKDSEIDNDQHYVKDQKLLIEQSNDTLYKKDQHNLTFDLPKQGYDYISNITPLGMSMLSNHADRGYDYRDFPNELTKDKEGYDPYLGYLHEYGLIGKNKSRYNVDYINIDSANRTKYTTATTKCTIKLDRDPFLFIGSSLRIYLPDNDCNCINLHDKITINGVSEKEITMRSIVTNDFGTNVNYFEMEDGKQYMTITADNNIQVDTGLTTDIRDIYTDMIVDFKGFIGDKKIEWYFDTKMFVWDISPTHKNDIHKNDMFKNDICNNDTWHVRIMEDVLASIAPQHKCDCKCQCKCDYKYECKCQYKCQCKCDYNYDNNSKLTKEQQMKSYMMIADFIIDSYGTVIKINIDDNYLPYRSNIVWTDPLKQCNDCDNIYGNIYGNIPDKYYTDSLAALTLYDLHLAPSVPTTFYKTMDYFDKVQNIIRPIFLRTMKNVPNFISQYESKQISYPTLIRLVVPEAVKVLQTNMIGNIPVNMLNSRHRMYLTSAEIEKEANDNNNISINTTLTDIPLPDKFYIKLNNTYKKDVLIFVIRWKQVH